MARPQTLEEKQSRDTAANNKALQTVIDITTDVVKQLAITRAGAKVAGDSMYDAERQPPA